MLINEIIKEITTKNDTQALEIIAEAFAGVMDNIYLDGLIPYSDKITNNLDAAHSYLRKAINQIKNG